VGSRIIEPIFGIILIFVAMALFPGMVMEPTHEMLTDSAVASGNVTTGVGETSGTLTLQQGLYDDDTANVSSVTSSLGTDAPIASSYVAATRHVTITGLTASQTRELTVSYLYDATSSLTGMGQAGKMGPMIMFLGILGMGIGLIYHSIRGR